MIGILACIIVHLLLFATAPYLLRSDASSAKLRRHATPKVFNIEIVPSEVPRPPPKSVPNRYIEANPNAPDKVPDQTNNFSSQNQVLAQEKPDLHKHDDTPKLTGKKDVISNQTVSGRLTKPQESAPPVPKLTAAAKTVKSPRQEKDPLAGFDKMKQGDDGFGSNLGTKPDVMKPAPQKVTGSRDALTDGTDVSEPVIDPRHPRARPVLNQVHTRPAIFQDNNFGTANIGATAYSAKWNSYGAYLHKMLEAIQVQWDRILTDSETAPPSGSYVDVKFTIDSKGKIDEIVSVENTSSEQGKASCLSAVTMTAPYGEWTPDMIAMLGDTQDITIRFYYE